jgi:hypothetical protein
VDCFDPLAEFFVLDRMFTLRAISPGIVPAASHFKDSTHRRDRKLSGELLNEGEDR